MNTSILHLTDIHAGTGELVDEDEKVHVPGAARAKQLARLGQYLRALHRPPDFVVVTGDLTIRGDPTGLQHFRDWMLGLMRDGVLPDSRHVLITPGNHDVSWTADGTALPDKERFRLFFQAVGTTFPHANIPDWDPPLDSGKPKIAKTNNLHFLRTDSY